MKIKIISLLISFLLLTSLAISSLNLIAPGSIASESFSSPSARGAPPPLPPLPDEVDLFGVNVWLNDSSVPSHNNLGFRVMSTASLTIYPGITVKFDSGTQLLVEGTLRIIGSESRPVNLTSSSATPSITDWGGIKFESGSTGFVNHSNITYCSSGVNFISITNCRITNNTIHETQIGIKLESGSDNNIIDNNTIFNNDVGIALYDSDSNEVFDNNITHSATSGISLTLDANNNEFTNNQLLNGSARGISISGNANNNTFFSNYIISNTENGIRCSGSPDNVFEENSITSNVKNGLIFYKGSDRNQILDNDISLNTRAGIAFEGGNNCQVWNNTLSVNGFGIMSSSSQDIFLFDNSISSSNNNDMELTENSTIYSENNTFDNSSIISYDTSKLIVYYHMFLETRDISNQLTSSKVNITNGNDNLIIPDTQIAGKLDWIKCIGYIQKSFGPDTSMNPYLVSADNGSKIIRMGFDMSTGTKTCVIDFLYYPPPESTLPSKIEFPEEAKLELNLSKYFSSSEEINYDIDVLSGGNISYSFDSATSILSGTPVTDWNGKETLRVTGDTNLGGHIKKDTELSVTPVNDPPKINQVIPNQFKKEAAANWELNLSGFASDVDLIYGDSLYWFVSDINESMLNITITGSGSNQGLLFALQNENVSGNEKMIVSVKDEAGEQDYQEVWVNITPTNDGPSLSKMNVIPGSGSPKTIFNFTVRYFDIDGDLPEYVFIRLDNKTSYDMAEVDEDDLNVIDGKDYIYSTTLDIQAHFFWFECHDSFGGYASTPRVNGPIVSMANTGSIKGIVLDKESRIPISDALVTVVNLDNLSFTNKSTTDISGNYALINLIPGKYQLYATALGYFDSKQYNRTITKGGISKLNFELMKLPEDIIDTLITNVSIEANRTNISADSAITFIGHATDLDGDVLTFYWLISNNTEPIWGKQISYTFRNAGSFNVTLAVFDTDGNFIERMVTISVHPTNKTNDTGPDGSDGGDGGDGDGDGSEDTDTSDITNDNLVFIIILIIIFVIILIIALMFVYRRQLAKDSEAAAAAAEEEEWRVANEEVTERKRRRRNNEIVDKDKQNAEQINFLISDMHRKRVQNRRDNRSTKSEPKTKTPRPPRSPKPKSP